MGAKLVNDDMGSSPTLRLFGSKGGGGRWRITEGEIVFVNRSESVGSSRFDVTPHG